MQEARFSGTKIPFTEHNGPRSSLPDCCMHFLIVGISLAKLWFKMTQETQVAAETG